MYSWRLERISRKATNNTLEVINEKTIVISMIGFEILEMSQLSIQKNAAGIAFKAKIVPGSSKTALVGVLDGMVKIKVSAAPEKGKANKCLIDFLAKKLRIKKNDISIVSGQTNPVKQIQIDGMSREIFISEMNLDEYDI